MMNNEIKNDELFNMLKNNNQDGDDYSYVIPNTLNDDTDIEEIETLDQIDDYKRSGFLDAWILGLITLILQPLFIYMVYSFLK